MANGTVLLKLTGITKRFPGVLALDSVDMEVMSGEVHGLTGENVLKLYDNVPLVE